MTVTEKFTGKADIYAKYRPSYPSEYIDYLISYNNLTPDAVVADIGSGTGKLTRLLLERNLKVLAVEPNNHMRSVAEAELNEIPGYISMKGTAEGTGIDEESVDLITVAQAFHWFDAEKFKLECRRILKPDANVALVWNCRDFSNSLNVENEDICRKYCASFNGFHNGFGDMPQLDIQFYREGKYDYQEFACSLAYDLDGFIGRNLSASYAPGETEEHYSGFVEAIAQLFKKYMREGIVLVPIKTRSYIGMV